MCIIVNKNINHACKKRLINNFLVISMKIDHLNQKI